MKFQETDNAITVFETGNILSVSKDCKNLLSPINKDTMMSECKKISFFGDSSKIAEMQKAIIDHCDEIKNLPSYLPHRYGWAS